MPTDASAASKKREHVTAGDLGLYTVFLREEAVAAELAADEPPARSTRDPQNETDFYGWQKPKARKVVKRMEKDYGVKARSMTSYTSLTFTAFMSQPTLAGITADARVLKVEPTMTEDDFSWADTTSGSETIPWGLQPLAANDGYTGFTSPNFVYMIDGVAMIDGTLQTHPDLNITVSTAVNYYYATDPTLRSGPAAAVGHANHVAGIIGAINNNFAVRGVSPGIPIVNVIKGNADDEVRAALNWTFADAQQRGIYGTANISSSSQRWSQTGTLYGDLQNLKTRVLVVQAAGNLAQDACGYAYGPAAVNDGYLVVGGINESGEQAVNFNNTPSGYASEAGSNYGSCVEVWAPATNIWSTWNRNTSDTMLLSGTSMAAPHVSALAARYGNALTNPAQREQYIRSRLFWTGRNDTLGNRIGVPTLAPVANVSVTQAANVNPAYTGRDVVFTVTATNTGPDTAANVVKYVSYDALSTLVWVSPECTWIGGNSLSCSAGNIVPNGQHSSTVVVRKDSGSGVVNSTTLSTTTLNGPASSIGSTMSVPLVASPASSVVTRYRLYNPNNFDHLYTIDVNEYNALATYGWLQEGTQAHSLNAPGSYASVAAVPFYRLYNPTNGFHLWTAAPNEYYTLVSYGWGGEGAFEFILPTQAAGTIPLYRMSEAGGRHLWTIDANEYAALASRGWAQEGVAGYVIP